MSIGKRIVEVARSNLNSLLDQVRDREAYEERRQRQSVDEFLRQAEEEVEAALRAETPRTQPRTSTQTQTTTQQARPPRPPTPTPQNQVSQHYALLQLANGATLAQVKDAYRRLMRQHHPDRYAHDTTKQRQATEMSQKLSRAYMELRRHLGDIR